MTTDLITRLQAAEVGSRELDAEIALLFAAPDWRTREYPDWARRNGFTADKAWSCLFPDGGGNPEPLPAVTTSLDAAVALLEAVLPGQACAVGTMKFDPAGKPWATIWTQYGDPRFNANAATTPLALCIALLSAKEQP